MAKAAVRCAAFHVPYEPRVKTKNVLLLVRLGGALENRSTFLFFVESCEQGKIPRTRAGLIYSHHSMAGLIYRYSKYVRV